MKELDFTIALIDKVTRPLKQIEGSMMGFGKVAKQSFLDIGAGAMVAWGAIQSAEGLMSPALEMQQEMKKAAAMGVDDTALKQAHDDALNFSMAYGKSATEFVQSTAMINSSINGLTDQELPKVTYAANLMAAAVGGSTEEASGFFRQMFGQFATYADSMGKSKFAEELTGKMAYMKQAFGTSIADMQDMLQGAHGAGTSQGVGLDEQFAVLGQLHKTMGNEASGSYEAFMQSATSGMQKLGLAATDSSGKLLPMMTLLQEIQGKYGKSIEGNAKAQADLNAAFGSGALVVSQLYGNTQQLEASMRELGGSDSMRRAMDMAAAQASTMDRLNKTYDAIRITIGETLLPEFNNLAGGAEDTAKTFERWMTLFPNIAHVIGLVATAAIASAGAFAVWKISAGLLKAALWPLNLVIKLLTFSMKGATIASRLMAIVSKICRVAMLAWQGVVIVFTGVMWLLNAALDAGAVAMTAIDWPILLAVVAIAALAFGAYELYKHWDELNAAIANTAAWQALVAAANWVGESFAGLWQWIVQGWDWLVAAFGNFSFTGVFTSMIESIKGVFSELWEWIKSSFSGAWNWIAEKLNNIPGINLDVSAPAPPSPVPNTLSTGTDLQGVAPGGINGQINNNKSAVDKSKHIGQVNIYPQQPLTPAQLMEWQEVQPL